jgi:hypothetical protein
MIQSPTHEVSGLNKFAERKLLVINNTVDYVSSYLTITQRHQY